MSSATALQGSLVGLDAQQLVASSSSPQPSATS